MQNSLWIQGQRLQFALCARLLDIAEKIENDDRRKQNILQYITNEQEADESDEEQALYTKNVLTELLIHFKFIKSTKNKPKRDLKVENQVKKALINSKNLTKLNFYVKGNFENDHKSAAAASSSSSDNLMYTPVMSDLHLLVLKEEGSLPRHPWANFLLAYRKLPSVISLKHAYTPIQTVHARTCTITFCYLSNPGESRPFVILKGLKDADIRFFLIYDVDYKFRQKELERLKYMVETSEAMLPTPTMMLNTDNKED